jgi:hypothetical protein
MALGWAPVLVWRVPGPSLASPSEREPSNRPSAREAHSPILHKLVIWFFTGRSHLLANLRSCAQRALIQLIQQKRIFDRMKRSLAPLVVFGALVAMPGSASAAPTCQPGEAPSTPPLYCIPPVPPATPAAAAHETSSTGAHELSFLTPATLSGKSKVDLSAFASGPGVVTIALKAKLHGKTVVIGTGKVTVGASGSFTIVLSLTKAAKSALARRKGALKVTLTSTFTPLHGKAATAKSQATLK